MQKIATNIDTVTAAIVVDSRDRVYIELSGEIERFDSVDVVSIAAAHGYRIGDVVDECTYSLI